MSDDLMPISDPTLSRARDIFIELGHTRSGGYFEVSPEGGIAGCCAIGALALALEESGGAPPEILSACLDHSWYTTMIVGETLVNNSAYPMALAEALPDEWGFTEDMEFAVNEDVSRVASFSDRMPTEEVLDLFYRAAENI